jgi:hypothetical protein
MTASDKKPSSNAQTRKLYRDVVERLGTKFTRAMKKKPTVNTSYDVPYLAGYSEDGKIIYIDQHLPLRMGKIDILPYLLEHEHSEKVLEDVAQLPYEQAHAIATMLEHQLIEKDGHLTPKEYEAHIRGRLKTIEHERLTKLPPDLDLKPYKASKDYALLKRMHAAQHGGAGSKK